MDLQESWRSSSAKYAEKRRKRGEVKVSVWVHKSNREELLAAAKILEDPDSFYSYVAATNSFAEDEKEFDADVDKMALKTLYVYLRLTREEGRCFGPDIKKFGGKYIKKSSHPKKKKTWKLTYEMAEIMGLLDKVIFDEPGNI